MIRSPRNPLDVSTYRPNTKCIWTITAAANNMRGAFYIPRLQLDAPTGNCGPLAEDRIAIRKNTGDRDYVYLCGEKGERSLVYTMQHQSTLEFTADFESKSDGFLGLFFEYDPNTANNSDTDQDHDEPTLPPEEINILNQLLVHGGRHQLCQSCAAKRYLGNSIFSCLCSGYDTTCTKQRPTRRPSLRPTWLPTRMLTQKVTQQSPADN
ncbi:uncharacterized protein LOC134178251 isoform X2 [Corticium candelabrum]|uniref:uncharacterized protein LOC134178251 isoform X2 n=1 Tax=Corticium candelabrum TaxID=121492 RepID=UPI002E263E02|nr:uncharacterized protein LOC134178251 isoform X2 [Corticium candelabrum]